jgi:hypothetical protein
MIEAEQPAVAADAEGEDCGLWVLTNTPLGNHELCNPSWLHACPLLAVGRLAAVGCATGLSMGSPQPAALFSACSVVCMPATGWAGLQHGQSLGDVRWHLAKQKCGAESSHGFQLYSKLGLQQVVPSLLAAGSHRAPPVPLLHACPSLDWLAAWPGQVRWLPQLTGQCGRCGHGGSSEIWTAFTLVCAAIAFTLLMPHARPTTVWAGLQRGWRRRQWLPLGDRLGQVAWTCCTISGVVEAGCSPILFRI